MASVMTVDEIFNPNTGVSGVTGTAGLVPSLKETSKAVGTKLERVWLSANENIILLKKVIKPGAHFVGYGKKEKFYDTIEKIYTNPHFRFPVTKRSVQEKFNNIENEFQKGDSKYRKKSGVADGVS